MCSRMLANKFIYSIKGAITHIDIVVKTVVIAYSSCINIKLILMPRFCFQEQCFEFSFLAFVVVQRCLYFSVCIRRCTRILIYFHQIFQYQKVPKTHSDGSVEPSCSCSSPRALFLGLGCKEALPTFEGSISQLPLLVNP